LSDFEKECNQYVRVKTIAILWKQRRRWKD